MSLLGESMINLSDLSSKMYILRMDTGESVRFVKVN